jgi:hypothetical protein
MATAGFVFGERFFQQETGHTTLVLAPNDVIEPEQHIESPVRIRHTVNFGNFHNIRHQGGERCNLE